MINITAPYNSVYTMLYDSFGAPQNVEIFKGHYNDFSRALPERANVLDVGCGGGHFMKTLLEHRQDLRLTGVDASRDMVTNALARLEEFKERARILEGDVSNLRLYDNSFDGVYSMASIKHWPDRLRGISEIYRVTKPGAPIMIIEMDRGCSLEDARYYIEQTNVSFIPSLLPLSYFRTFLAGQSLDLNEAREYWGQFAFSEQDVRKIPYLPFLVMYGKKSE